MITKKFDEFVIFNQFFDRSVQLSSSFGKTFSCVRDACWYKDKVYKADIYRKNNTCTSCVFNGFKYIKCPLEFTADDYFVTSNGAVYDAIQADYIVLRIMGY